MLRQLSLRTSLFMFMLLLLLALMLAGQDIGEMDRVCFSFHPDMYRD